MVGAHKIPICGTILLAVISSGCVAVDVPAAPAPPLPDTTVYFMQNAEHDKDAAVKVSCPDARPPEFAIKERQEGWVVGGVDIRPDGTVENVTIHAKSDPRFEQAARACFMATVFYPAEDRGRPVESLNHPMLMHYKIAARELRLFSAK